MPSHKLYVDDSGTKEYGSSPSDYGDHRTAFFVFGSVLLPIAEVDRLTRGIRNAKRNTFGSKDVEIKSHWLRRPQQRKERYLEPFGITEAELENFVGQYYDFINACDLTLIAAAVDKPQMQKRYPQSPWYAPAIAYEILLQRVQYELSDRGTVSITVDDMTGATPKHNQYKDNLKRHHRLLRKQGSQLQL